MPVRINCINLIWLCFLLHQILVKKNALLFCIIRRKNLCIYINWDQNWFCYKKKIFNFFQSNSLLSSEYNSCNSVSCCDAGNYGTMLLYIPHYLPLDGLLPNSRLLHSWNPSHLFQFPDWLLDDFGHLECPWTVHLHSLYPVVFRWK